ncbi:hypothetical protein OG563_26705 [Nocardia vinacea]|uniref:Uncharacterized protein n=1 Tax=Nocardia vinacea TaxID=96468 RepID=A0ABZ1YHY2_9NOCA|nr:hypothetical protein [Nocardia vinacea]
MSNPRPWTEPHRNASGGMTYYLKTCCTGCGRCLGDATTEKIERAIVSAPALDTTAECGCATAGDPPPIDFTTRCPQRYMKLRLRTPEELSGLECTEFHEHHPLFVRVTDAAKSLEADRLWTAELRRIAGLEPAQRAAEVRRQRLHHMDQRRVDGYAERLVPAVGCFWCSAFSRLCCSAASAF